MVNPQFYGFRNLDGSPGFLEARRLAGRAAFRSSGPGCFRLAAAQQHPPAAEASALFAAKHLHDQDMVQCLWLFSLGDLVDPSQTRVFLAVLNPEEAERATQLYPAGSSWIQSSVQRSGALVDSGRLKMAFECVWNVGTVLASRTLQRKILAMLKHLRLGIQMTRKRLTHPANWSFYQKTAGGWESKRFRTHLSWFTGVSRRFLGRAGTSTSSRWFGCFDGLNHRALAHTTSQVPWRLSQWIKDRPKRPKSNVDHHFGDQQVHLSA